MSDPLVGKHLSEISETLARVAETLERGDGPRAAPGETCASCGRRVPPAGGARGNYLVAVQNTVDAPDPRAAVERAMVLMREEPIAVQVTNFDIGFRWGFTVDPQGRIQDG